MLSAVLAIAILSVRLSVCQTRALWQNEQTFHQYSPIRERRRTLIESPETPEKYRHLLVIIDSTTIWLESFLTKSTSAEELAQILCK